MAKKSSKKTARKKTTKRKVNRKQQRGWFSRLFRFCFKWGFVLGIWAAILLTAFMLYLSSELSSITKSMVFERRPAIIIKASNGEIVDRYGDIKGEIIDVKDLPDHVVHAVIATEDRRFYNHLGIDPLGIARAFVVNVQKGGFVQGGSTITQQLAKNLFLTRERTIKRKLQEVILAVRLESELTKDEILSAYLNRVYLGSGAYGIDAASQTYFKKSARDLSVKEAATIAGLLKAPSRFSPNANPRLSAERTKVVLKVMADAGYIEDDEYNTVKNSKPIPRRKPSSSDSIRYFTDYVVNQIEDLIGPVDQDIIVETTLNQPIQQELEESITKKLLSIQEPREVDQAAGMVMRLDGAVMAIMGGGDYDMSEYNRVTESLRPPGSSFKPIVYLTAIENGWDVYSMIMDEPRDYGSYRPRNFGNKYYGPVTLYEALTLSLNTVAVALMKDVGPPKAIQTARRLGITADLESSLSTALGSNGIPMIQMITAYATIGRGGSAIDPYAIKKITDNNGITLYERTQPQQPRQVVEQEHAAQVNLMMQSVVQNGTGKAAALPYPTAGKTGTSQEYRDAWFIGYTDKYVGAIWFGNDDNSPTKALTGGSAPAQVWREVMLRAQAQGGRSYASFYTLAPDRFDTLLGQILNSLEFDGGIFNRTDNDNGWFDDIFNSEDRDEILRDRRFDPQTGQIYRSEEPRFRYNPRQNQFRREDSNRQTQGGYSSNVND
ncbi:MAG: PBP1A family penicillin-binding protein [Pseudomonadota bacterium]